MSLAAQLSSTFDQFSINAPSMIKDPINEARNGIVASFDPKVAVKEGDRFPGFSLKNAVGSDVTLSSLLSKGPLLITFYRGEWCPFCNMAIASLQAHLGEFTAAGVTLVAVSPELPNGNMTMQEKHDLKFAVLSDEGNKLARQLGIVWKQPDTMRPIFEKFGHNLPKRNGDDSNELPLPSNFLLSQDGIVKKAYIEPDYTKRLEPEIALEWVKEMRA